MGFALGDPVRIEMEKWGDRPHWRIPARWLGSDEYGDWLGIPAGTRMVRPGRDVLSQADQVGLVPALDLPDHERAWLATFHAAGADTWVYVDMTTPPRWDGPVVRAVDLDLDVIRMQNGWVLVDDEDEFAEHRVSLSYPHEIVSMAVASRDRVHAAILDEDPPFDGHHLGWQAVLDGLTPGT